MRALALYRGGAGLTIDERDKLTQYLQKPFKAFSTEEAGYPLLKQILRKMERLMNEGKLKLKSDKKRKAQQDMSDILNRDSLAKIYVRCVDVATQERLILNSEKMAETRSSLSMFQEQTKRLTAKKARIEAHEAVKERAYEDAINRISSTKKTIEKNVFDSLDQKVHIT
jgi:hypothetical protein